MTSTPPSGPGRRPGPARRPLELPAAGGWQPLPPLEQQSEPATGEFARVIDDLRARYRPGVPDDELPADVSFTAACRDCLQRWKDADTTLTSKPELFGLREFRTLAERDEWATGHANATGHHVALAVVTPSRGTTLTGVATSARRTQQPKPGKFETFSAPPPPPPAPMPPSSAELPLIAFIVPAGGEPDLMCRIPERAGASWLITAAHSCLLAQGAGSSGVPRPHRVMFIGKVRSERRPDQSLTFTVTIDGVAGATDARFGRPIGARYGINGKADPATVEDAVEQLIATQYNLDRHEFSVALMNDPGGYLPPPDPAADQVLREARARARNTPAGGPAATLLGVPRPDQR